MLVMKHVFRTLALFLLVSSMIVSFAPSPLVSTATTSTNLVVGVPTNPPTTWLQTATNWGGQNTWTQVPYLYCYTYGVAGTPLPDICNVPSPVPNSNDTQWIVNLKSANMKWSDGAPINASDLAYSYGIFLPTGPYANLSTVDVWGNIQGTVKSISILNSTAVKLQTFTPDPLFLFLEWLYQIYPWHYYKQFTGNNILGTTSILGGPGDTAYIPKNYTAGSNTISLVANPSSPSWNGATPEIQTVTLNFFTQDTPMVNALAAGTVDAALIQPSDIAALNTSSFVKIDQIPSINQIFIYVEPVGGIFSNQYFRQALMTLVPKYQIDAQLYGNKANVGNSLALLPQAVSEYMPSNAPQFNFSTTQAVVLLKQAGLVQTSSGSWQMSNGTAVSVTIDTPSNDPNLVRAAQMIVTEMKSVGLSATANVVDVNTVSNEIFSSGNYQMTLFNNAYFPSPYKWMRNPVNLPLKWVNTSAYAQWHPIFQGALQNLNPTQSLQQLKQAESIVINDSIIGSVLVVPQYVAYNTNAFTNYEPALANALNYQTFYAPMLAENFLTAVQPAGTGSSISATSQVTTAASSTTTSVPPPSANYSLIAAIVVVIIIIAGVGVYLARRRRR